MSPPAEGHSVVTIFRKSLEAVARCNAKLWLSCTLQPSNFGLRRKRGPPTLKIPQNRWRARPTRRAVDPKRRPSRRR